MNLDDPAIESPRRTALIIAMADHLGLSADLASLIPAAYEAPDIEGPYPYYTVALDDEGVDNRRALMLHLIQSVIGSDDDFDDAAHDMDHALGTFEACEHDNCPTCCDECLLD